MTNRIDDPFIAPAEFAAAPQDPRWIDDEQARIAMGTVFFDRKTLS